MNDRQRIDLLLVEDNPSDAELVMEVLREQRLADHTAWVKDGDEALDYLFRRGRYRNRPSAASPKLVLLDLRLPKVDGIEVLRTLKADERTRLIPVVILTSSREDRDIGATYALGANSYVAKPVEFAAFARTLALVARHWLRANRPPMAPA